MQNVVVWRAMRPQSCKRITFSPIVIHHLLRTKTTDPERRCFGSRELIKERNTTTNMIKDILPAESWSE